ncbi:MAG: hypothetical protein RIE53_02875 [Rhodothermales bacterium]
MTDDILRVEQAFTDIRSPQEFDRLEALIHAFQKARNPFYARFNGGRHVPIEAFKRADMTCFPAAEAEVVFRSSGTGGVQSRHLVRRAAVYERSIVAGFRRVFGPDPVMLLTHAPSYAPDSSLVWMMHVLQRTVALPGSGFLDRNPDILEQAARASRSGGVPLVLFGAAFGLLDIAESGVVDLPTSALIVETGGMKTHRRHVPRAELHARLSEGFSVDASRIGSEYGMCELLSQCWTGQDGLFRSPPWMRWDVRDPLDPERSCAIDEEGLLAVTDLANMYSLSFVLTEDRAVRRNGTSGNPGFEILGRASHAELRGCNFLFEN